MQKKQLTLVVVSLLVVVLSVSLAWFTTQIIGKGKSLDVSSTNLQIVFTDSDGAITGADIEPGWSDTKKFTIQNNSKSGYEYNIVIKDLVNTFVTEGYLQYKITSTNNGYNMTDYIDVPKSSTATDTILAYSVSIPMGVTQTYTIEFRYVNDENVDQSVDMNKVLKGTLFITEGSIEKFTGYKAGTLGYKLLEEKTTRPGARTDFSTALTTENTKTLYTGTEEGNTVYYFAGNATDNWVKFGTTGSCIYNNSEVQYADLSSGPTEFRKAQNQEECLSSNVCALNGMAVVGAVVTDDICTVDGGTITGEKATYIESAPIYWRIIRTNSDGSIKLLYSGTSHDTIGGYLSLGNFNFSSTAASPKYVGYKYGDNDDTLANARTNTNNSTIKTAIDKWYASNMTSYTKYLSTTAVYCNDRNITSGTYSTSTSFYYAAYTRLNTNKSPTYYCANINDKFTVSSSTGNGKLTYPIALMTADEVSFAGGVWGTNAPTWYYYNSVNGSIVGSTYWWTMSPAEWFKDNSNNIVDVPVFTVEGSSYPGRLSSSDLIGVIRPVTSLKSCVKYSSGDGTAENPYTIEETSTGC